MATLATSADITEASNLCGPATCLIGLRRKNEWQVSYTCEAESLETNLWRNQGTLGSQKTINLLTGTRTVTTTTYGYGLPALCFSSSQTAITNINYHTTSAVNPELTMEIWIKPTAAFANRIFMFGSDDGGYDRALYLNRWGGIAAGVGEEYVSTVSNPNLNEWTQIIVTYSKSAGKAVIYKHTANGNEELQKVNIAADSGHVDTDIGLNALSGLNVNGHNFVGCIAQVQITNRSLSSEEVRKLYDEFDQVTTFGCEDIGTGTWKWNDGRDYDASETNWAVNEPNNYGTGEVCEYYLYK